MATSILITLSAEELQDVIGASIRKEMPALVAKELLKAMSTPPVDRLIPRAEAMDLLGIRSRDTMLKLERSGDLTPIRIGNRVSYSLANIQEFKNQRG